jgi:hypothetical protein
MLIGDSMAKLDIDLKNLQVSRKYELFNCKSSPFPFTGVSSGYLGFPPTDEKATEELLSFIVSTYDRKSYGGLVILGDYGFGKTYILRHLERRINEALYFRGTERACAVYIDNPEPPAIEDFITKFLDRFGMHKFLTLLWHLVIKEFQEEFIEKGQVFLKGFFRQVHPTLFEKGGVDIKEDIFTNPLKFVDWLYESKADLAAIGDFAESRIFGPIFQHPDITKRLSSLDKYSSGESYRKWMETLNYKTFKTTIRKEIDPSNFFRSVLTVFRYNGFRHVYLLVDEFEDVYSRMAKKGRLAYCGALRNLIENNLEYFSLVVAVTAQAWDKIAADMNAFAERFVRRVELMGLNLEQLRTMIVYYLDSVREKNSAHYGTEYPFEAQAIAKIQEIGHANHRVVLEICYVLFEYAADKKITSITAEMVKNLPEIREGLIKARRGKIEL